MLQDYMNIELPEKLEREKRQWRDKYLKARESKPDAPVLEKLTCFISGRDSIVEQRMIERVLDELGGEAKPIRAEVP